MNQKQEEQLSVKPEWNRWELARDLILFQVKLALDGTRDLLLSPISVILGVGGLLTGGPNPGRQFYELLRWGHKTDRWISLFTAADAKLKPLAPLSTGDVTADSIVSHLENVVKEKYQGR